MDAVRSRFPECPHCGHGVDENDPETKYTIVNHEFYHVACLAVLDGIAPYRRDVEAILVNSPDATRNQRAAPFRNGEWPLSEDELEEMAEAYLLGVSAKAFALKLAGRDISDFERASEPCDLAVPFAENH